MAWGQDKDGAEDPASWLQQQHRRLWKTAAARVIGIDGPQGLRKSVAQEQVSVEWPMENLEPESS